MLLREFHGLTMNANSNEENESDRSPKMKTCEVNNDFISNLPDPILVHILSYLPLRDAIRTVLLRRFGKLWLSMPVLDLDNCLYHESGDDDDDDHDNHGRCEYEKFMDIIHQVWNHHENITLDKLHLAISFVRAFSKIKSTSPDLPGFDDYIRGVKEKENAAADQIEKLVRYALSRKVKVLDLNFLVCGSVVSSKDLYEIPDVFSSNYLRDLKLASCSIRSCGKINLPALRVLSLNDVSLSDKVMEKLLCGCPLLEDISVVDSHGLRNFNCESPNLKKVMLSLNITWHFFLSCPHTISLEIAACNIRSCGKINLPTLRVLSLNEVSLDDEIMEKLLSGCPLLEDISVVYCRGLCNMNFESPDLKKVMLSLDTTRRFSLSCPHAVSLEISGWMENGILLNVSSLVDASIFFWTSSFECKYRIYTDLWRLLLMVHRCETFASCGSSILVMSTWKLRNFRCLSFEWKNLMLKLDLTTWHLPGLCFLFKSCPSLETLTMCIFRGWDDYVQIDEEWILECDFDGETYWDSQEATFPFLESIMIYGHINAPYVIQLVKFLLRNAPKLQKMEISTKKKFVNERLGDLYTSEQLLELSQELVAYPRASPQAMICVS